MFVLKHNTSSPVVVVAIFDKSHILETTLFETSNLLSFIRYESDTICNLSFKYFGWERYNGLIVFLSYSISFLYSTMTCCLAIVRIE